MTIDVLIVTALLDELDAVLALGDGGASGWSEERDQYGFIYHTGTFSEGNISLKVAAAWNGGMNETPAAMRSQDLAGHLKPRCLAMCGICAGRRGEVFLGDVIVADRVFSYDHGKLIANVDSEGHRTEEFFHDIRTYNLGDAWAMNAAYMARDLGWSQSIIRNRPMSVERQRLWLLGALLDARAGGVSPQEDPRRPAECPGWSRVLDSAVKHKLISNENGTIQLTTKGEVVILDYRLRHPGETPADPPFAVHIGPIATGKTVREDPELFNRLKRYVRKILGAEMEAAAIAAVAERVGIPSIIVKSVSDYGDDDKDDGFRKFACSSAAGFLRFFVLKQLSPETTTSTSAEKAGRAIGPGQQNIVNNAPIGQQIVNQGSATFNIGAPPPPPKTERRDKE